MRLSIIPAESKVNIDGVARWGVDCSSLDPTIHAIQWDGTKGHIEFTDPARPPVAITNIDAYQYLIAEHARVGEVEKYAKDPLYSAAGVPRSRAELIAYHVQQIKLEAGRRIVEIYPQTKQLNIIADRMELGSRFPGVRNGDLDAPSHAMVVAGTTMNTYINAVRSHSNALEQQVAAIVSPEELVAWTSSGWPAAPA